MKAASPAKEFTRLRRSSRCWSTGSRATSILSHDMIEGAYARAGLVSDIEVVDDYPSHMSAFSRRKHRWVRGDWQIIFWLLPRVPDFFGKTVPNPLSVISRWKILDNLRRSLTEIATFVMLLCGWLFLPGKALYWTLATLAVIALPTYWQFAMTILRAGQALFTAIFWKNMAADFGISQANLFMRIAWLLPSEPRHGRRHRAVHRTHDRNARKAAGMGNRGGSGNQLRQKKSPVETYLELTAVAVVPDRLVSCHRAPGSLPGCIAPVGALGVVQANRPVAEPARATGRRDKDLTPITRVASPVGVAHLAAVPGIQHRGGELAGSRHDPKARSLIDSPNFDDQSRIASELAACRSRPGFPDACRSSSPIPRERSIPSTGCPGSKTAKCTTGTTLGRYEAVKPRFISAVDNGNLVCSLWTVKQGCLGAVNEPIFRPETLARRARSSRHHRAIARGRKSGRLALIEMVRELKTARYLSGRFTRDVVGSSDGLRARHRGAGEKARLGDARQRSSMVGARTALANRLIWKTSCTTSRHGYSRNSRSTAQTCHLVSEKLTLESLPKTLHALDQKLSRLLEEGDPTSKRDRLCNSCAPRSRGPAASPRALQCRLERVAERADALAKSMDFNFFLDAKKKLLFTGYNVEEGHFTPSHYDLLASEARSAIFVAIAKGDIPQESWLAMERRLTSYEDEHVLLSWTGTMFEYLMPLLWMKTYPNTIIDQTTQGVVRSQQKYAEHRGFPGGFPKRLARR